MGTTVPYGLRFPVGTDVPNVPVRIRDLAEDVNDQILRVDDDAATLSAAAAAATLAASNIKVLGTINSGAGTNTTEFSGIDQTYRDLLIIWQGISDGSGEIDSLAVRFNGDSGDNYHSRLTRPLAAGDFMATDGALDNYTFSVLRAGYVGTLLSAGTICIPNYAGGGQKLATGANIAVGQSGATNIFPVNAGGRWTGTDAITSIRIWPSGQLWQGNPHLTLLGLR
jgi:hypothetical protein